MSRLGDAILFLRTFGLKPWQVGSMVPSSQALADRMAGAVPWDRVRTVVELGAGVGPITAKILERKPPGVKLLVFEREPKFQEMLRDRFPGLSLYAEATEMETALAKEGVSSADAVVCSIPIALLSDADLQTLLDAIDRSLAPGGIVIFMQYSRKLLKKLRGRYHEMTLSRVLVNWPPAIVVRCVGGGHQANAAKNA